MVSCAETPRTRRFAPQTARSFYRLTYHFLNAKIHEAGVGFGVRWRICIKYDFGVDWALIVLIINYLRVFEGVLYVRFDV